MPAISLDTARNVAAVIAIVLVALALLNVWLLKNTIQKVVVPVVLIVIAIVVWQQRASLGDCADEIKAAGARTSATCSFFGFDVDVPAVRS